MGESILPPPTQVRIMVQPTSASGILHDLFTPLPPTSSEQRKDPLDYIADYTDTASGAWDVFRIGEHIFTALQLYLPPAHEYADLVGKVKGVFSAAGVGLSIPQFFSDANTLRRSFINLFTVQDLPYTDALRDRKIAQARKKSFLDTMNLTFTVTQIALFIDSAKIFVFDTMHLRIIDGINNATSFITDGAELVGEYFKLQYYLSPEAKPRNAAEAAKLEEKKILSWMTIAKDVASVALATIAIGAIVFGIATSSIAYATVVLLGISAFWLTMKLTAYFYNKIVVEAPINPQQQAILV
jgi:hypothetical protein